LGDQIKKGKLGRTFGTHEEHEKYVESIVGKCEGNDHLEDIDCEEIILKLI
jgi:hypothetical protein